MDQWTRKKIEGCGGSRKFGKSGVNQYRVVSIKKGESQTNGRRVQSFKIFASLATS